MRRLCPMRHSTCHTVQMTDWSMGRPLIWAHRGASGYETDNTIEAFDLAVKHGADGIESDVRVSVDGTPFLFHDDRVLYRGRPIRPEQLTVAELESIDLGDGRRIPTLEEVLRRYSDVDGGRNEPLRFSLDVIPSRVGTIAAQMAERFGMGERTVITPCDADPAFYTALRAIREVNPTIPIVRTTGLSVVERGLRLLPDRPTGFDWKMMDRYRICGLNLRARHASAATIAQAKKRGLDVYVWDCHDEETMRRFATRSVDGLYTNYPDVLRRIMGEEVPTQDLSPERR